MGVEEQIQSYIRSLEDNTLRKPKKCAVCKKRQQLRWHGFYQRNLMTLKRSWSLSVRRIQCKGCHRTFGLLPEFVVKFHRYGREVIRTALQWLKSETYDGVVEKITRENGCNLGPLTLYWWKRSLKI